MPPSTSQKSKGAFIVIGVALFILALLVYLAPYGIRDYLVMRKDLALVNKEISTLKEQNQELRDEISHLKSDTNYIEMVARKKLGMLKKNEMVFEVPEKKEKERGKGKKE